MHSKRGQITYFIALGVIILLAVAAVLYYNNQKQTEVIELLEPTESVPIAVQPLKEFADSCLDSVAHDSLITLGLQGGYLDPEEFGIFILDDDPTFSQAVEYRRGAFPVAYWWYLKSHNRCNGNCEFDTKRPPLEKNSGERSIEMQIRRAVENELQGCLRDFEDFEAQGYQVTQGEMKVETSLGKNDFRILVTMPLTIVKDGQTHEFSEIYSMQDVNLRKLYEMATLLTASQSTYNYLERSTINLIAAFGDINEEALPPMYESSFEPDGPVYWSRTEVKDEVEDLVAAYTPLFQVPGSKNYIPRDNLPDRQRGMYQLYNLPVNSLQGYSYGDVNVKYYYHTWWPTYFDIGGRGVSGEMIGPEQGFMPLLSFMGFARYNNYYDMSYPVVVELYDTEAYGGKGYSFNFALESNLRNNEEMTDKFSEIDAVVIGDESLLCNANQRNSGDITVTTTDARSGLPLSGVSVTFACGDEACMIGATTEKDGVAGLEDPFPLCAGGRVVFDKRDYETKSIELSTFLEKPDEVTAALEPYRELELKVEKWRHTKFGELWKFENTHYGLLDSEVAIVVLTRVDEDALPYETAVLYRGNETSMVELLPGTYQVETTLLFELPSFGIDRVVIPEEERAEGPVWNQQKITLPEISFNTTFVEGGGILNEETGYVTIEAQDLDTSDTVTFYAIASIASNSFDVLTHDDMDRLDMMHEHSKQYREQLEPSFS